jgi:hypothetical protein
MHTWTILAVSSLILATVAASAANFDTGSGSPVYYRYGEYIESDYRLKIEAVRIHETSSIKF